MTVPITIRVFDFTGCPFAVSAADGQRIHDRIIPLLREGKPVELSFVGIEAIIAAFLSAAVGQLYSEFSEEQIRGLLAFRDIQTDDRALLDRVGRNAKAYYEDPKAFDDAWQAELGDEVAPCKGHVQPLRCRTELKEGAHHA
jgi:hypothetical protein